MNVPKIRFSKYNYEWNYDPLNKYVERIVRKNKNKESDLVLTISAQYGLVDQCTFFNRNVSSSNLDGYYLLYNGDFAYNKSYSNGYPWGAVKRLNLYDKGVVSSLYICFNTNTLIDSDYLQHYFETNKWYSQISSISVEGARNHGLLNITVNDFFNTEHFFPTLAEQKDIAKVLNLLDKKIELQSKKIEDLKLFKLYIRKKIFSSNTNNNIRLKEIVNCESSNITLADIENDNGIYPVYGATGFIKNIKNYKFDSEYIVIVKDGAGVGRTMICPKNSSILATMNALTIKNNYPLNYICEMINTISFDKYIVGSGIPHIYFKDYGNEEFMLHNENDANKFDSVFKCLDRKIELLNVSLDKLNILKKGLMQGMFV